MNLVSLFLIGNVNSRQKGPILKESKFAFSAVIDVQLLLHFQQSIFCRNREVREHEDLKLFTEKEGFE